MCKGIVVKCKGKPMPRIRPVTQPKPSRQRVQVTLTLPPDLLRQIDKVSRQEDRTRSKVVERAVREALDRAVA